VPVDTFEYTFPAIKGIQAGREYYTSMCPLKLIPKIFLFDEEELLPEVRAQRSLNRVRIPEMAAYVLKNQENYVFSALTASIDGPTRFTRLAADSDDIGSLHISMQARFLINDGQHRRAAIEMALKEEPILGDETIAIVFFLDRGLDRCQQMFADLNRHAIRPSKSLGLLYDHRDETAKVAKLVAMKSVAFKNLVEMEKSSLAARSQKLFTLSAIHSGNAALLGDKEIVDFEAAADQCATFWDEVAKHIPEWTMVREAKMVAGDVRKTFLHTHALALQALGNVGRQLVKDHKDWRSKLQPLRRLDWSRNNAQLWEGRALIGGRVSKSSNNITLTGNAIKQHLDLKLTPEEERVEALYARGDY
jgi:DNA sulfur modification protein DndB